jgi:hypothetical protein
LSPRTAARQERWTSGGEAKRQSIQAKRAVMAACSHSRRGQAGQLSTKTNLQNGEAARNVFTARLADAPALALWNRNALRRTAIPAHTALLCKNELVRRKLVRGTHIRPPGLN